MLLLRHDPEQHRPVRLYPQKNRIPGSLTNRIVALPLTWNRNHRHYQILHPPRYLVQEQNKDWRHQKCEYWKGKRNWSPIWLLPTKKKNVKEQVNILAQQFPTWVTDVNCLEDSFAMISDIGQLTGKEMEAVELVGMCRKLFDLIFKENT